VDVQGPEVVRPYTEKFKVTFPVAVDTADVLGRAFGLKAIPVTYLVDEVGIVRLSGGGPGRELLQRIEEVLKEPRVEIRGTRPQLPAALDKSQLESTLAQDPGDWQARLALARVYDAEGKDRRAQAFAQCEAAAALQPGESAVYFTWGLILMHDQNQTAALGKLRQARDLDPDNWRIRKQIWAIEHPDKFYNTETPDYRWQREELARERQK
jgi:tetratricopeptide (TPR) repeat protein